MTYLRLLRLAASVLRWAMRHVPFGERLWAELADLDGRVAFRQVDYAKRVQKASGWEPVQVHDWRPWILTPPTTATYTAMVGANTMVTYKPSV